MHLGRHRANICGNPGSWKQIHWSRYQRGHATKSVLCSQGKESTRLDLFWSALEGLINVVTFDTNHTHHFKENLASSSQLFHQPIHTSNPHRVLNLLTNMRLIILTVALMSAVAIAAPIEARTVSPNVKIWFQNPTRANLTLMSRKRRLPQLSTTGSRDPHKEVTRSWRRRRKPQPQLSTIGSRDPHNEATRLWRRPKRLWRTLSNRSDG